MTTSTSTVMDMVRVLCWIGNNITLEGYGVESRLNCFSIYTGNNQKFITRGTARKGQDQLCCQCETQSED